MCDINLTHVSEVRYGHETALVYDCSDAVAEYSSGGWRSGFLSWRMREGEPPFLLLNCEYVGISFASPYWGLLMTAVMLCL